MGHQLYVNRINELQQKLNQSFKKNQILRQKLNGRCVQILLCDEETSHQLNLTYRNIDKPTDVLSWSYEQNMYLEFGEEEGEDIAGELAICVPISDKQAAQNGWAPKVELLRLVVHGIAHILEYDHDTKEQESKMIQFEKELLNILGQTNIYS